MFSTFWYRNKNRKHRMSVQPIDIPQRHISNVFVIRNATNREYILTLVMSYFSKPVLLLYQRLRQIPHYLTYLVFIYPNLSTRHVFEF